MAKTIGGTIVDTGGVPVASCSVDVELVLAQGFIVTSKYSVAAKRTVQTDVNGAWSLLVTENDSITPTGTLYQITERIPPMRGRPRVFLIQVLTSLGGGTNQVLDLVVPAASPVGVINNFVTKSYLDTIAVGGSTGPTGPAGGAGEPGYATTSSRATLDSLSPPQGKILYQVDRKIAWVWNGTQFQLINVPAFTSTAQRDANITQPLVGDVCYLDLNTAAEGPYFRNHAGKWEKPWNVAWGEQAYAQITANQNGNTSGTDADITGLSVTWTAISSRIYLIQSFMQVRQNTSAASVTIRLKDGSTTKQQALTYLGAGNTGSNTLFHRETGLSGSKTYKMTVNTGASTCDVQAGNAGIPGPAWIRVEDIGPSGAPV